MLTVSPVRIKSFNVEITGNPAPTVDSLRNLAPLLMLDFTISSYSDWFAEKAFIQVSPHLRSQEGWGGGHPGD